MNLKMLIYKMQNKFLPKTIKSSKYIEILRMNNVKIGEGTYFFSPSSTIIDYTRPYLLEIGKYCKITSGVKVLTHDYSRSVLRLKYGDIIGEAKKTVIGDNVFIGVDSIILMGAQIGNNVIIGAGSVVSGKIPDNVVVAGNPAKVIRTLDEHYKIRKEKTIKEAKEYAKEFIKNRGDVTINEMGAFFPQYLERNLEQIEKNHINIRLNGDDVNDIKEKFLNSKAYYKNFNEFKTIVKKEMEGIDEK